jgi:eukaryotic-like serine/threonine-protein kinase
MSESGPVDGCTRELDSPPLWSAVGERDSPAAWSAVGEHDSLVSAVRGALLARAWPSRVASDASIGRYRVLERIGAGGMGEVLVAEDRLLGRRLAIKLVHAELAEESDAASNRLVREGQALASVNHPNVVQVFEIGTLAPLDSVTGSPLVYIAMELVEGGSLRDWLKTPRSWRDAVEVLVQVARGLQAVHDMGLVHRDVKPENVLVGTDVDGERDYGRVRLVDFGLARLAADVSDAHPPRSPTIPIASPGRLSWPSRLTATGAVIGTPAYMAPEQLRRETIDARCDQYSFCVMLWEALSGTRPFAAKNLAELVEAVRSNTPRMPAGSDVPPTLWAALRRGLAYEPHERYADMNEVIAALRSAASRPRRPWKLAALGAGACTIAIAAAFAVADERCGEASESLVPPSSTEPAIERELHRRADAIAAAKRDACATGTRSGDHRLACLARLQSRLTGIAEGLVDGVVEVEDPIERGAFALAELPEAESCMRAPDRLDREDARIAAARGEIDHAWAALDLGRLRSADARRRALQVAVADIDDAGLSAELDHLAGEIARQSGDPAHARELWLQAATVAESEGLDDLAADVWISLVFLAVLEHDVTFGESWWRSADAAVRRAGADARRMRELGLHKAGLLRLDGDLPGALAELDRLLVDAPGPADPGAYAWTPVWLERAAIAEATGDLEGALVAFRHDRDVVVAQLGESHQRAAMAHYNVGQAEVALGRGQAGRRSLEQAAEIWSATHGPDYAHLAVVHTALQDLEMREGSISRARVHAEAALRIRSETLPEDHVDVGLAWLGLGAAALLEGDADAAVRAHASALAVHERALGASHPQTALVRANAAEARLAAGAVASALADAARAVTDLESVADLDRSVLAFACRVHGSALLAAGEREAAIAELERARSLSADGDPLEHGIALVELARALEGDPVREPTLRAVASRARLVLDGSDGEQARAWIARLDRIHPAHAEGPP